jgi:hypothetical protein
MLSHVQESPTLLDLEVSLTVRHTNPPMSTLLNQCIQPTPSHTIYLKSHLNIMPMSVKWYSTKILHGFLMSPSCANVPPMSCSCTRYEFDLAGRRPGFSFISTPYQLRYAPYSLYYQRGIVGVRARSGGVETGTHVTESYRKR